IEQPLHRTGPLGDHQTTATGTVGAAIGALEVAVVIQPVVRGIGDVDELSHVPSLPQCSVQATTRGLPPGTTAQRQPRLTRCTGLAASRCGQTRVTVTGRGSPRVPPRRTGRGAQEQ